MLVCAVAVICTHRSCSASIARSLIPWALCVVVRLAPTNLFVAFGSDSGVFLLLPDGRLFAVALQHLVLLCVYLYAGCFCFCCINVINIPHTEDCISARSVAASGCALSTPLLTLSMRQMSRSLKCVCCAVSPVRLLIHTGPRLWLCVVPSRGIANAEGRGREPFSILRHVHFMTVCVYVFFWEGVPQ